MGFDLQTQLAKFLADLYAGTLGVTLPITAVEVGDGTAGAPSLTFASESGLGAYRQANHVIGFSASGAVFATIGDFTAGSGNGYIAFGNDAFIGRDGAASTVALKNGNNANELRVYAGNGSYGGIITVNESLTIAASPTTDSSTTIPAGSIILAVAVRVTTVIPTAATFTVTAATGGTTFDTAAVSTAANSTDKGTAAGALYTSAGTKVRITPNLTPGAATGVVRLTIFYFNPVAPTS